MRAVLHNVHESQGVVLVTGLTGSDKTVRMAFANALCAFLRQDPDISIMIKRDPQSGNRRDRNQGSID
jgi:type II secretory ATPase GspE/PulE/Tfp pilus assembly ATPase PilB-like protein